MTKQFIAVLGKIDENTTEKIPVKEIAVSARDHLEAHKLALFKCNLAEGETVFQIREASTRIIRFDHKKGFSG
jgi:hypothetical protein